MFGEFVKPNCVGCVESIKRAGELRSTALLEDLMQPCNSYLSLSKKITTNEANEECMKKHGSFIEC